MHDKCANNPHTWLIVNVINEFSVEVLVVYSNKQEDLQSLSNKVTFLAVSEFFLHWKRDHITDN